MKSMVASHRGTNRLISKLLVLGLCLSFTAGDLQAQDEGTTPPPADPLPAVEPTKNPEAAPEVTPAPASAPAPAPTEENTQETKPAPVTPVEPPPAPAVEKKPTEEGLGEKIKEKVKEGKKIRNKHRKETTDALLRRRGKDPETAKYIMLGEAQTLPEKVVRFRYVRRNVAGNQTWEEDGKKRDIGIDAVVNVNAYVFEYGLTDKISLQFLVPQIASNQVTINTYKFVNSKVYAKKYKELMDQVVPFLVANNATTDCGATEAQCLDKINNKAYATPTGAKLVLPTGEVYTTQAGVPIERNANSLITNAAKPKEGVTGISDITVAALFNVYSSKWQMISVGAGFRLPTGKAEDEKSYKRTGAGFTTLGLAVKYDYRISDPFMLSFSNQTEIHLKNAHYKRYSLIDPDELNTGDPSIKGANIGVPGDGDNISNNYEVSRKVPANYGYLRAGYALGALHPMLATLSVFGYYNWSFDPEVYYDGYAQGNPSKSTGYSYALAFDGLGMQPRIPIGIALSQDRLITGENVAIDAVNTYFNLTLYYKF